MPPDATLPPYAAACPRGLLEEPSQEPRDGAVFAGSTVSLPDLADYLVPRPVSLNRGRTPHGTGDATASYP